MVAPESGNPVAGGSKACLAGLQVKVLSEGDYATICPPGGTMFIGSGAMCPHALIRRLLEHADHFRDVELIHLLTLGPVPWTEARFEEAFRVNAFFLGPGSRESANAGIADYTPVFLSEIPQLLTRNVLPLDTALIMVSPPDEDGLCSLGTSVDIIPAAIRNASKTIAQINRHVPVTQGRAKVPISDLDIVYEHHEDLPEMHIDAPTPEVIQAARNITELIVDGDTLQLGIGRIPAYLYAELHGFKHLGIHSELITDGIIGLIEAGVVDGSRKRVDQGKTVASFALGSHDLYAFVGQSPTVELHPTEYVNSPLAVAKHDHFVAINSALQTDLSGQVATDSIGHAFFSGIGGQVDFIRGASLARHGKSIVTLPSTATLPSGDRVSRIVSELPPGAGVVTTRADVDYVVTEYGIASLKGRSIRQRALELCRIAHPDFRDDLFSKAVERRIIPGFYIRPPTDVPEFESVSVPVPTKSGEMFQMRPLHESDERRLQHFFYSHSQETIMRRYGHAVHRMSRKRAAELVGVDQRRDLALAIVERLDHDEVIHAVGRFFTDNATGKSAEMAFVTRETMQGKGFASALLRTMLTIAKKREMTTLWAILDANNRSMMRLFKKFGAEVVDDSESSAVEIAITLG